MRIGFGRKLGVGLCLCLVTAPAARVQAVLTAKDFVAIRRLEPSAPEGPQCQAGGRQCADGSYSAAGISNAGDVFGRISTLPPAPPPEGCADPTSGSTGFEFCQAADLEAGIRWLRNTNYTPDEVGRGPNNTCVGATPCPAGESIGVHASSVTSSGIVYGRWFRDGSFVFRYDLTQDQWTDYGPGEADRGNNLGRVTAYDSQTDAKIVGPSGTLISRLNADGISDISDNNVVVGQESNDVFKWEPAGESQWPLNGSPLAELGPGPSQVMEIDDSGTYAIGSSQAENGFPHAIVWHVPSGAIAADLGSFTRGAHISGDGTIVTGDTGLFTNQQAVWSTADGWTSFATLTADQLINQVPGGSDWSALTQMTGVNDQGQIVGNGVLASSGTSAVFRLDTLDLAAAVLKADVNNDARIDNLDITPFIAALSVGGSVNDQAQIDAFLARVAGGSFASADTNMDDTVNNLDITPFVSILASGAASGAAVPEPASLTMLGAVLLGLMRRRGRGTGR